MLNKLQLAEWRAVHHLTVAKLRSFSMINSVRLKYSLPCFLACKMIIRDSRARSLDVNTSRVTRARAEKREVARELANCYVAS